tara:strand:+ start:214 stop:1491 length:1278 start_codon:yes stop_codon:yes gene_type:complete
MKTVKQLKIEREQLPEPTVVPFELLGIKPIMVRDGYKQVKSFKSTIYNAILLLGKHPNWEGKIKLNTWSNNVHVDGDPIEEFNVLDIIFQISSLYNVDFTKATILDAALYVAKQNPYNPFKDYIESIELTPSQRQNPVLDRWLVDYFGVEDSPIIRVYAKKWAIGCIARSLFSTLKNPIQHDLALLLYGGQGIGKSTGLRALAMKTEWFSDTPLDMSNTREACIKIQGVFLYELKELAKRSGIEAEKAFIDTRVDKFRPMYGRTDIRQPRRCNLAASTNDPYLFRDSSGSRRWLAVECTNIKTEELKQVVDQLWKEALEAYLAGEQWWLTNKEDDLRKEESERFNTVHPWKHKIEDMIKGGNIIIDGMVNDISPVNIMTVLDIPINMQNKKTLSQIGYILNELGYYKTRVRLEDGTRPTKWIKSN